MSKTILVTLVKRQKQAQKKSKSNDLPSFSTPKIAPEPKTDKARKIKSNEVARESTITHLEEKYLDPIRGNKQLGITGIRLSGRDLAVINRPDLFKDVESKPDRRKNRAVDYMLHQLMFLNFLLENFNETYRKKIWYDSGFQNLIDKYLGTAEYTEVKLTPEERKDRLTSANKWLMSSLTIIEDNLPMAFRDALKETSKPYFKLLKAIADYEGIKEIHIPDRTAR